MNINRTNFKNSCLSDRIERFPHSYPIITVLGPTATGKTHLAVRLAAELGGEIISADSRQLYRRMNIGTGKDLSEYVYQGHEIPYYMIDVEEPGVEFNVFRYQQGAYQAMKTIEQHGKRIILCGGSGMYIEAVLRGYKLFPVPENPALRSRLLREPDEILIRQLAACKSLHNDTDTTDRNRLIRAIEIEDYYECHPELQEAVRPVPSVIIGLRGDRDLIRSRITTRLQKRLQEGMVEEVRQLLASGVSSHQLLRYGLEYKFVTQYLHGELNEREMFDKLNVAIHQFSKRQMTWFRRMERQGMTIHWIDVALREEEKMASIYKVLAQNGFRGF